MKKILFALFVILICFESCNSQSPGISKEKTYKAKDLNIRGTQCLVFSECDKDSISKAISLFKKAIELDNTNMIYYSNLASTECKIKNYKSAIKTINQYLNHNYENSMVLYKGLIFERTGIIDSARNCFGKVMNDYDSSLLKDPNNIKIKLDRASLLFFTQGNKAAIEEYKQIEKQYPDAEEVRRMKEFFETFNIKAYLNDTFQECD